MEEDYNEARDVLEARLEGKLEDAKRRMEKYQTKAIYMHKLRNLAIFGTAFFGTLSAGTHFVATHPMEPTARITDESGTETILEIENWDYNKESGAIYYNQGQTQVSCQKEKPVEEIACVMDADENQELLKEALEPNKNYRYQIEDPLEQAKALTTFSFSTAIIAAVFPATYLFSYAFLQEELDKYKQAKRDVKRLTKKLEK